MYWTCWVFAQDCLSQPGAPTCLDGVLNKPISIVSPSADFPPFMHDITFSCIECLCEFLLMSSLLVCALLGTCCATQHFWSFCAHSPQHEVSCCNLSWLMCSVVLFFMDISLFFSLFATCQLLEIDSWDLHRVGEIIFLVNKLGLLVPTTFFSSCQIDTWMDLWKYKWLRH